MNTHNIITSTKNIINLILLVLLNILVIILMSDLYGDFSIGPWYNAFFIVLSITIANTLLWPIFKRFFMKFMIQTLGIGTIFINALIFYIACYFIPNVDVGFYASIKVPFFMSIATTVVTNMTNTNYYNRHLKNIVKYALNKKNRFKKLSGNYNA